MSQLNSETAKSAKGQMATVKNVIKNGMISTKGIGNGPIGIESDI